MTEQRLFEDWLTLMDKQLDEMTQRLPSLRPEWIGEWEKISEGCQDHDVKPDWSRVILFRRFGDGGAKGLVLVVGFQHANGDLRVKVAMDKCSLQGAELGKLIGYLRQAEKIQAALTCTEATQS